MKIKIGEFCYTSRDLPLMIILDDDEKKAIADMDGTRYAQFSDGQFDSEEKARAWMKKDGITPMQMKLMLSQGGTPQ